MKEQFKHIQQSHKILGYWCLPLCYPVYFRVIKDERLHFSSFGVSVNVIANEEGEYLSPGISAAWVIFTMSSISSFVNLTFAAPLFSSRYLMFLVPGITTMFGAEAKSQASVTCPAVALCLRPISSRRATTSRIFGKFSRENLGTISLKSPGSKSSGDLNRPVRIPLARGAYATIVTPNSFAVSAKPIVGSKMSRKKGDTSCF